MARTTSRSSRPSKKARAANGARPGRYGGVRLPYEGPVSWLFPRLEQTYTRLGPKDEVAPALLKPRRAPARSAAAKVVAAAADAMPHGERLVDGKLADLPKDYWASVLGHYHRRRLTTVPQLSPVVNALGRRSPVGCGESLSRPAEVGSTSPPRTVESGALTMAVIAGRRPLMASTRIRTTSPRPAWRAVQWRSIAPTLIGSTSARARVTRTRCSR